jgi:galactonate dehydratase
MIRPDLSAAGFAQVKKIASLAEASFVGVFSHLMVSPVNIAAFVQLDAAFPNYVLREGAHAATPPLNEIVDQPLMFEEGRIIVPSRLGIGIEIREGRLAKVPYSPSPSTGNFHADGSVAHQGCISDKRSAAHVTSEHDHSLARPSVLNDDVVDHMGTQGT